LEFSLVEAIPAVRCKFLKMLFVLTVLLRLPLVAAQNLKQENISAKAFRFHPG